MLWDDTDQEAEKALMGAEYDSFAKGKVNIRDREWWALRFGWQCERAVALGGALDRLYGVIGILYRHDLVY